MVDCHLQLNQIDQAADSCWDGPVQLVLIQVSIIEGPAKLDSLLSGSMEATRWIDCSLQVYQVDQVADSFWDGPAQLVLSQVSMIKGPAKSDPLFWRAWMPLRDGIAPYKLVTLTRLLILSGMGPLSWLSHKLLRPKPSQVRPYLTRKQTKGKRTLLNLVQHPLREERE
jgi:uncharacterized protein (DUF952 family)